MSNHGVTVHTARKDHGRCSFCPETIVPGERYVREVLSSPWDHEPDVDDEGRTVSGGLVGTWTIRKGHQECFRRIMADIS